MRTTFAAALAFVGTLGGMAPAHAQTLYVVEHVVVSVNAQADGSGERIGQIKSGDQVELIERQDEQAHIRLGSGEEGWVKASYLSESLPLQQQLKARNDELERVRKEKTQLEADLAAARKAASAAAAAPPPAAAAAKPAAAKPVPAPPPEELPQPPPGNSPQDSAGQGAPPLFSEDPMMPSRPTWLWTLGASILSLGVGFAVGWRLLDRRIRAKYGGLRIY